MDQEQSQEAQLANIANILGNLVFFMQGAAVQSKNVMLLAAAEDATKSFTALMNVRGEDFALAEPEEPSRIARV